MALLDATKNAILTDTGVAELLLYASLHDDDPSTTGANEVTGGSPAYARKQLTWGTASGGSISATKVTFDVPATTIKYVGYWSAATDGTFRGSQAITNEVFAAQGEADVTPTVDLNA